MSTDAIRLEPKNYIVWGFIIAAGIAALIIFLVSGMKTVEKLLPFYGFGFGILLILDAIFFWRIFVVVRDTTKTEYRVACGIIGVIFIVLAVLEITKVI